MSTHAAAQVAATADYHRSLLSQISDVEGAPAALEQQIRYLADLASQLSEEQKKAKRLGKVTERERHEHESIQKSIGRRWTAKLTGRSEKFEGQRAKEEKEYIEALEEEINSKTKVDTLKAMISDGEHVRDELRQKEAKYLSLKAELAALYSRVFDGPSPEYPEDDNLEARLNGAQQAFNLAQSNAGAEERAGLALDGALKAMKECRRQMAEAHDASSWDVWGGGSWADAMERSALADAQRAASQAQVQLMQAKLQSLHVNANVMDGFKVVQGNIISDVLFDNVFSDLEFHDKIKRSEADAAKAFDAVQKEVNFSKARFRELSTILEGARADVALARQALDDYRRAVYEGRAGQWLDSAVPQGPLPGYAPRFPSAGAPAERAPPPPFPTAPSPATNPFIQSPPASTNPFDHLSSNNPFAHMASAAGSSAPPQNFAAPPGPPPSFAPPASAPPGFSADKA